MSSTKSRTRTNATQMIETTSPSPLITNITSTINGSNVLQQPSPQQQQQQQYVPSLLKIESVVPMRLNATRNMQRANRLMTRSYSTLCGPATIANNNATTPIPATAAAAYVNGLVNHNKNVARKINTNLHRHKNHHHQQQQQQQQQNERHESPTNKLNGQTASDSTNVIVENGVHKVRRTAREREKQPDRINLDRRGLCTIPIIDNEPSLRLLSLQHNLINTFHIPDCDVSLDGPASDSAKDSNNNVSATESERSNKAISTMPMVPRPLLRQKSRNQLNLNFGANAMNATPATSFLQKSFMFQGKNGIGLKRANSVLINYSPTQTPTGSSPVAIQQSPIFGTAQRGNGRLIATPSFSMIDANFHHDVTNSISNNSTISNSSKGTPELQIDSNNSYMNSFRFNLSNLVFLDLYNNQIEKISNLDGLKSLTVLLLGKNRISDITGIICLKQTLRVLDLHGNRITHIAQKICQLQELKSLNLAGNLLRQVQASDFAGLCCLKELNLKRNRIKRIIVSDDLHNLERLWLCHNELQTIEDMSSIAKSINLKEITIENNPISLAGDCVSFLVSYLPLLVSLNQLQITEQVRRAAHAWRKGKETSDQNYKHLSSDVNSNIRREEIISNARTNWELIRSQQANIVSGNQRQSNQIKKTIKTKLILTTNNSSSSMSTGSLSSNVVAAESSSGGEIGASGSSRFSRNMMDVPKRQIAKLLRSTSHDNTSSVASEREADIDSDYRLPPMIDQLVETSKSHSNNRSASSTRPQIDSASESDFGDSTEEPKISRVPTTPPINQAAPSKPPSPVEIVIVNESDGNNNGKDKTQTPPLPPIATSKSSSSSKKSNNEPVASSSSAALSETCEERTIKDIQNNYSSATATVNNNNNNINDALRIPSPIVKEQQRATLSIIDIDNSSGISLQPTTTIETESVNKSKMEPVDSDKLSMTSSKVSSKANESINSAAMAAAAPNEEHQQQAQQRQVHSSQTNHHLRNRSGARKVGPPLVRSQTARNLSSHLNQSQAASASNQQNVNPKKEPKKEIDKDREQGGDYLVEILGRYLNVYGVGAIKFVDKQWNSQKASDVHTVKFSYINFNSISPILSRIKVRFPNIENYVFRETNLVCLGQLNALADTQGLKSITIDPEGNHLVVSNKNWRAYAIWRLNHWGLKQINGLEITDEDVAEAEATYSGLSDLVLWSLPEALLNPLFTRLRVEEMLCNGKITPKEWLMKQADESIRLVVGKEALQWKKTNGAQQQDEAAIRRKGKLYFGHMMENTVNAVEKLQKLEYLWPNILLEMIRNTLIDYSQIDLYVRNLMNEINSASSQK